MREIVDRMAHAGETDSEVTVRTLLEQVGRASFAPMLMVPAFAVVTPLSGVRLFSSLCGCLIALVASQVLLGRRHLWLPKALLQQRLPGKRLKQTVGCLRGPAA